MHGPAKAQDYERDPRGGGGDAALPSPLLHIYDHRFWAFIWEAAPREEPGPHTQEEGGELSTPVEKLSVFIATGEERRDKACIFIQ